MQIVDTELSGVKVITFGQRLDERGSMNISLDYNVCKEAGFKFNCLQQRIYHAPQKYTFYGIHFQGNKHPQAKLIYCISGKGIDYIVDLKKESPTYKKWISIEICGEDNLHIYIPQGYGHAFLTLEDDTMQLFSVDEYFYKDSARSIRYNDKEIDIQLPVPPLHLSKADRNALYLKNIDVDI